MYRAICFGDFLETTTAYA